MQSLELYQTALRTPGGDQLRTHNGIYLASMKLNKKQQAADAFGKVVDFGLTNNKLAVKFLFKPGSTQLSSDAKTQVPYPMWLSTISQRAAAKNTCLEVVGHTSTSGPEPLNVRLAVLRAEYLKDRLAAQSADLSKRMIANGVGSKECLVCTRPDGANNSLDRRVEFKMIPACSA